MQTVSPISSEGVSFTDTADLIVVGLGAAGASAAIEGSRAGLDVLVLERASGGGGSTAASGGYVYCGGGTRVQKANGFDDSVADMIAYLTAVTPQPDAVKIRAYCEESVAHFNWLEAQGVPFNEKYYAGKHFEVPTDETLSYTGNEKVHPYIEKARPAPRGHQVGVPGAGGNVLINKLIAAAHAAGARFQFDAAVNALITDSHGRVVGIRFRRFGQDSCVAARRGVLLATGGFAANRDMTREHCPFLAREDVHVVGGAWSDGAGVRLGAGVGAVAVNMDGILITSPLYPPESLLRGLLVNKWGKRFVPEDSYHGRTTAQILRQPDQKAWLIVDNAMYAPPSFGAQPVVDAWESVAEMEAALGIPTGALQETVSSYNQYAMRGEDPEQHKQPEWVQPLRELPFAALDCSPGRAVYSGFTLGGLAVDVDGRVLDRNGKPIPGLYAAGATASNIAQDSIGYSSGVCIGESTYFARRVARAVAVDPSVSRESR
jgi:3-oxo-5alpha-steroid 4-dehydrogenase